MENKSHASNVFKIENCRAKIHGAGDLVDCLALEQVRMCHHVLPFGSGFFCLHPQKLEFVEKAKLQARLEKLEPDNQE